MYTYSKYPCIQISGVEYIGECTIWRSGGDRHFSAAESGDVTDENYGRKRQWGMLISVTDGVGVYTKS